MSQERRLHLSMSKKVTEELKEVLYEQTEDTVQQTGHFVVIQLIARAVKVRYSQYEDNKHLYM